MNIQEYLQKLLDLLLFDNYEIEVMDDEQTLSLRIILSEEDSGILIGRHGETLSAIQRLIRTVYADQLGEKRIVININDYRDQREEKIRELIDRGIERMGSGSDKYHLYRLNSAERFFAHNLIANDEQYQEFTSFSINDEDGERVLVIERKTA